MKLTLSWLKQHLDTQVPLDEICLRLTALGLEVDGVEDPGKALAPFIVAQIVEAVPHPNADRLRVCTVDTGNEKLQVVCGAPNARAGLKTVLARPGDVMPDSGEKLKKGAIRGVESQGMLCAADELGLGSDHEGIMELAADAPVGGSFAAFGGYDDPIIDVNLTPNRPDCAGVFGIARDLAAAGVGVLKDAAITPVPGTVAPRVRVTVGDTTACPLFGWRELRGVKNGPSPDWLQRRLRAIGLRPISALVDITNYLTFDRARPLHVFDAAKIKGDLWIGAAKGGETFAGLNGKDYTLEAGMTVIGDDSGIISLAGIMGGASTACDDQTVDVLIESACFDAVRTAQTGRALQIVSDARYRFERGIDPAFTLPGLEAATALILDVCATPQTVVSTVQSVGIVPDHRRIIALDSRKCFKHTGLDVTTGEQQAILQRLGFTVTLSGTSLQVAPPSWRPDIEGAPDLVEEIIRVKGYDLIPATSMPRDAAVTGTAIDITARRQHLARRALAGQGLNETVSWSFMSSRRASAFGEVADGLRLLNPISADLDVMRPSILPNLIAAAARNVARGADTGGLFEIGPVFRDATPDGQRAAAAIVRFGHTARQWSAATRAVDLYDVKADVLAALAAAGAPVASLQITADAPSWYHPGRSGVLRLGLAILAMFGDLHPSVVSDCGGSGPMAGAEIFFDAIPAARTASHARPLLKRDVLQPVRRDFAFVVDRDVNAARVIRAVRDADKAMIREVDVFDVYEGDNIAADKKSLAVTVVLQPVGVSLTDAVLEPILAKIVAAVAKATGATLRT